MHFPCSRHYSLHQSKLCICRMPLFFFLSPAAFAFPALFAALFAHSFSPLPQLFSCFPLPSAFFFHLLFFAFPAHIAGLAFLFPLQPSAFASHILVFFSALFLSICRSILQNQQKTA